ncbi:MAG: capsular biosynthesis protein [Pseudomonadota bacterium]
MTLADTHHVNRGLQAMRHARRLLLLQGPVGPFFHDLAQVLQASGRAVDKINFNLGDVWFHPQGHWYRGGPAEFARELREGLLVARPDACILFGQHRPMHVAAREVLDELGIPVIVFEEGYVRPYFVTMEQGGVNMRSGFVAPSLQAQWGGGPVRDYPERQFHLPFGQFAWRGMQYQFLMSCGMLLNKGYEHHRPTGWFAEGMSWIRSWQRKRAALKAEPQRVAALAAGFDKQYFFVPLQVHNDSQQLYYSGFESIEAFIRHVVASFGAHAPQGTRLVFKHHPMDRGQRHYGQVIAQAARESGCAGRTDYFVDGHLPTLLSHAAGTVTVNSTVGLSSLWHGTPVKVCGKALYDHPRLTFSGPLADFWQAPGAVDAQAVHAFRNELIAQTQLPGTFYWPAGGYGGLLDVLRQALVPEPASDTSGFGGTVSAK